MKRYLLFCFDHYPDGGWDDFRGDFDTIEEAEAHKDTHSDYYHIVDIEAKYIVDSGRCK